MIKLVVFLALKDIMFILLVCVKNAKEIIVKNVGLNYFVLIVIHLVINIKTMVGYFMVQILEMVNVKFVHILYVLTALIINTNVKAVN